MILFYEMPVGDLFSTSIVFPVGRYSGLRFFYPARHGVGTLLSVDNIFGIPEGFREPVVSVDDALEFLQLRFDDVNFRVVHGAYMVRMLEIKIR